MKRTTISLPDDLMQKAQERARTHGGEPDNFSKYIRDLVRKDVNGEMEEAHKGRERRKAA